MAAVIRNSAKRAPTAIAMMNMGGPSTLPEVQGFLTNLFTDPEIIPMGKVQPFVGPWVAKNRTPKITEQYAAIGGGSPILKWTNIQGEEMCKILDEIRPEVRPTRSCATARSMVVCIVSCPYSHSLTYATRDAWIAHTHSRRRTSTTSSSGTRTRRPRNRSSR